MICEKKERPCGDNGNSLKLGSKRSVIFLLIGIFVMVGVTGCFGEGSEHIKKVKTGAFNNYPDVKIGEAFDSYFGSSKWEHFVSENDKNIVEFKGKFEYANQEAKAVIQFELFSDDTFEIIYFSINGVSQNKIMIFAIIEEVIGGYSK